MSHRNQIAKDCARVRRPPSNRINPGQRNRLARLSLGATITGRAPFRGG